MNGLRHLALALCLSVLVVDAQSATVSPAAAQKGADKDYFAIVGGERVPLEEFAANIEVGFRERFFHGRPPEAELTAFQREVADNLVNKTLLLQEAKRRGLRPNAKQVAKAVAEVEKRYKGNEHWKSNRKQLLPGVKTKLEADDLLRQLEVSVKSVAEPSEADVKAYYNKHRDLFTTPERFRARMILLKIDPSSPSDAWKAAEQEAQRLLKKLRAKADFAELARIHSADQSASMGGDLGYQHKGMLGQAAQQMLDVMRPGEISEPVFLLEGVAIFRLEDRQTPVLNEYASVKERAKSLVAREHADEAWKKLIADLRAKTKVVMNEKVFERRAAAGQSEAPKKSTSPGPQR